LALEKKRQGTATFATLNKLADALGLPRDWLAYGG
jgi:hypothetical protein